MSNRLSPNFLDYYNTIQLWDLQNEIASQTGLLEAIEERLYAAESQQAKERFVANLFFASEKIFNDLKLQPESNETAALCLEFDHLFIVELPMALSNTSSVPLKRDIDQLEKAFKSFSAFAKTAKYRNVHDAIQKIKRIRSKTKDLYSDIESIKRQQYYRPLSIVILNFAIWPIGYFVGSFQLIVYYYIVAIGIRLFGPSWVRSKNNKKILPLLDQIEKNSLQVQRTQRALKLERSFKKKHDQYSIWLDETLDGF